jgi:2-polyprenyl-3-methyl-5-hydroxy-6-metoxy-1,4-benzoquinol methylase
MSADQFDVQYWNERYESAEQVWSGNPNGALVDEVAGLTPGRALDVGCGEGADTVWLARQGWAVTGLDISAVAVERARKHAEKAGVVVTLLPSGLLEADLPRESFELVSAMYPVLKRTEARTAEHRLCDLVAPGGTLLFVHHLMDEEHKAHAREKGWDPDDFVQPPEMAAALGEGWTVDVHETRDRHVETGAGAGHVHDVVVRATRLTG